MIIPYKINQVKKALKIIYMHHRQVDVDMYILNVSVTKHIKVKIH